VAGGRAYSCEPGKWLVQPIGRQYNAPAKVKYALALFAIMKAHGDLGQRTFEFDRDWLDDRVGRVLAWSRRRAPDNTLRRRRRASLSAAEQAYNAMVERIANAWKPAD
jgi:hypothetical protein